jgi:hypothetical protein
MPHHAPRPAVARQAAPTEIAASAGEVDLADHAPAAPRSRAFHHGADELVPEHAAEAHVPLGQLEIGVAHAGEVHAHERAVGSHRRQRPLGEVQAGAVPVQRAH